VVQQDGGERGAGAQSAGDLGGEALPVEGAPALEVPVEATVDRQNANVDQDDEVATLHVGRHRVLGQIGAGDFDQPGSSRGCFRGIAPATGSTLELLVRRGDGGLNDRAVLGDDPGPQPGQAVVVMPDVEALELGQRLGRLGLVSTVDRRWAEQIRSSCAAVAASPSSTSDFSVLAVATRVMARTLE
jgi:hypothetical protein